MEAKEKKVQEMYMEFQLLDERIKQLQKQLEVITHQLMEFAMTSNSLDELKNIKPGNEIFVPLSSGIFTKANMINTSELLVNVGANIVVKKNVESTKKLIESQLEEMRKLQQQVVSDLEKMTNRAAQIEMQLQSMVPE